MLRCHPGAGGGSCEGRDQGRRCGGEHQGHRECGQPTDLIPRTCLGGAPDHRDRLAPVGEPAGGPQMQSRHGVRPFHIELVQQHLPQQRGKLNHSYRPAWPTIRACCAVRRSRINWLSRRPVNSFASGALIRSATLVLSRNCRSTADSRSITSSMRYSGRNGTANGERAQHVRPERPQVVVRLVHRQPRHSAGRTLDRSRRQRHVQHSRERTFGTALGPEFHTERMIPLVCCPGIVAGQGAFVDAGRPDP